jgi:hypothetical protein
VDVCGHVSSVVMVACKIDVHGIYIMDINERRIQAFNRAVTLIPEELRDKYCCVTGSGRVLGSFDTVQEAFTHKDTVLKFVDVFVYLPPSAQAQVQQ